MTTLTASTSFNIEATLNAWLASGLSAFTLPAWLPTLPTIIYDWSQITLNLPCFALQHIPVSNTDLWQGRVVGNNEKGQQASAILEVSCFVSKSNTSWVAQLRTMTDLVKSHATSTPQVTVLDYAANLAAPAATTYGIKIRDIADVPLDQDPNPGVARRRLLLDYTYVYRTNY